MIGRSRSTAPAMAASSIEWPCTRSWLMYSSMITPVCTETPKRARKPTPEETLKFVCVMSSASNPPIRGHRDVRRNQGGPLTRVEHRIEDREDQKDGDRKYQEQPPLRAFLALILSGPVNVVSRRQRYLLVHFVDGLFDRASEIATTNAVLRGDIALLSFAIDLFGTVRGGDLGELCQ